MVDRILDELVAIIRDFGWGILFGSPFIFVMILHWMVYGA